MYWCNKTVWYCTSCFWYLLMFLFLFFGALKLRGIWSSLKHDIENSQHPKKEKILKNLLQTLEYWCCSIFVSLVTQVLQNHPNYLCYLDVCFWFPCFKYGIIFLHMGSSARQHMENSWGTCSLLEIFLVILEDQNSFVVWYCFYGGWDSLSPKMTSMWLLYFDWGQTT